MTVYDSLLFVLMLRIIYIRHYDIINFNDITSATNSYLFMENVHFTDT